MGMLITAIVPWLALSHAGTACERFRKEYLRGKGREFDCRLAVIQSISWNKVVGRNAKFSKILSILECTLSFHFRIMQ